MAESLAPYLLNDRHAKVTYGKKLHITKKWRIAFKKWQMKWLNFDKSDRWKKKWHMADGSIFPKLTDEKKMWHMELEISSVTFQFHMSLFWKKVTVEIISSICRCVSAIVHFRYECCCKSIGFSVFIRTSQLQVFIRIFQLQVFIRIFKLYVFIRIFKLRIFIRDHSKMTSPRGRDLSKKRVNVTWVG